MLKNVRSLEWPISPAIEQKSNYVMEQPRFFFLFLLSKMTSLLRQFVPVFQSFRTKSRRNSIGNFNKNTIVRWFALVLRHGQFHGRRNVRALVSCGGIRKKIKIVRCTKRLYGQNEDVKITLEDAELPHLQIIRNED